MPVPVLGQTRLRYVPTTFAMFGSGGGGLAILPLGCMVNPEEAHFLLAIVDFGGNEDAAAIAAAGVVFALVHVVEIALQRWVHDPLDALLSSHFILCVCLCVVCV